MRMNFSYTLVLQRLCFGAQWAIYMLGIAVRTLPSKIITIQNNPKRESIIRGAVPSSTGTVVLFYMLFLVFISWSEKAKISFFC